jgi:chromosome segregation ATPase
MPYLLEDLVVNRVDLVDEGANSAAFIELYKRKERGDKMELKDIIAKMTPEHAAVVQAEIDRLSGEVTKTKESVTTLTTDKDATTQALAKAKDDLKTANDELALAKSELDTLKAGSTAFDEEETLKSMPEAARELFTKMKAQKDAAEETVRKAKEAEANAQAIAKASELKALPIEQEKLVGVLKGCSPELLEVLTTINAAVDGTVLGEVGKNKPGSAAGATGDAAWAKIEAKALEIAKTKGVSKAKAISQAVDENPDLYKEYLKGGAN